MLRNSRQLEDFIAALAIPYMMNGTGKHVARTLVVQRHAAIRLRKHCIAIRDGCQWQLRAIVLLFPASKACIEMF